MPSIINALTASGGGVAITGDATGNLALQTAGNTAVTIDNSQRVGVGVTPSAWSTGNSLKVIENPAGAFWNFNNNNVYMSQGFYFDGSNRVYSNSTNAATEFSIQNGLFVWASAPSGTAGGTVTLVERMRVTTTGDLQFNSGYGSSATAYGCRAWVIFNGTGTVTINGSGNVTSITDLGVGDYKVNITTAMPDTNYATIVTVRNSVSSDFGNIKFGGTYSTTAVDVTSFTAAGVAADVSMFNVSVFR